MNPVVRALHEDPVLLMVPFRPSGREDPKAHQDLEYRADLEIREDPGFLSGLRKMIKLTNVFQKLS